MNVSYVTVYSCSELVAMNNLLYGLCKPFGGNVFWTEFMYYLVTCNTLVLVMFVDVSQRPLLLSHIHYETKESNLVRTVLDMSRSLGKPGFMHARKASSQFGMCSSHKLIWDDTFRLDYIFA